MKYPDQKTAGMSGIVTGLFLTSSAAVTGIAREMSDGLERQAYGAGMISQLALAGLSFYFGDRALRRSVSPAQETEHPVEVTNAEVIRFPYLADEVEYEELAEVIFLPTIDEDDKEDRFVDTA